MPTVIAIALTGLLAWGSTLWIIGRALSAALSGL